MYVVKQVKMKRDSIRALFPEPLILILLSFFIRDIAVLLIPFAGIVWWGRLRTLKRRRQSTEYFAKVHSAPVQTRARLDAHHRELIMLALAVGRREVPAEEYFGACDQIAYEALEEHLLRLGGEFETLSETNWVELHLVRHAFAKNDRSYLRGLNESFALEEKFSDFRRALAHEAEQTRRYATARAKASKAVNEEPSIQSLAGPDLHLWHAIATDSHDFDQNETDVWWILDQPECDRLTVAEFLLMFEHFEYLEQAVRSFDGKRLTAFKRVVDRWNTGFYQFQTLELHLMRLLSQSQSASINRNILRISQETGTELPTLADDLFTCLTPTTTSGTRGVNSGWVYEPTVGLLRVDVPAEV